MKQTYDITASYLENYERGPRLDDPPDVPPTPLKKFLGLPVHSRLGIAAGLLLNSKWLLGYAAQGFDLLTYKTVRSRARECYPPPNWVFVDADDSDGPVYATDKLPTDPTDISSAVCFGMPSMPPEEWREDVARCKVGLGEGQLLIVSVVASPEPGWSASQLASDYAQCAAWAVEAGADVIAGSLIKNPGGGLAKMGGYIAGNADLITRISYRLTVPGIGKEMGASLNANTDMYQGFFMAPHAVVESLNGAVLTSHLLSKAGLKTDPAPDAERTDLIQSVSFNTEAEMITFTQMIQKASPVNSQFLPVPSDIPGYEDPVIMAAGTFVQGASLELSADGPVRAPYTVFVQGGLVFEHVVHALEMALLEMREKGMIML